MAETRNVKALHGLSRSLINNMVTGVATGFTRNLETAFEAIRNRSRRGELPAGLEIAPAEPRG